MIQPPDSKAVRMRLLGTFRVFVGPLTVEESGWRLKKAAGLVKLLALAPDHRLHREQVTEALWPSQARRMASNSFRQAHIVSYGGGFDRVLADRMDVVADDCERVRVVHGTRAQVVDQEQAFFESLPPKAALGEEFWDTFFEEQLAPFPEG